MAYFSSLTGTITEISRMEVNGCSLLLTVQEEQQGLIQILLSADTYVLNCSPLSIGSRATFFYRANAPMPLVYPPRYQAAAAALTPHGTMAALDYFNEKLTNSDNTLKLNLTGQVPASLPNGQMFLGSFSGRILLVLYRSATRSIPAQTTPEQVVVFCPGN